ncbi:MAG: hypothetical protein CMK59_08035 [Proteobacteria bacterium]|nr:hypothetical protein [Pseudomonadota bacterium]
MSRTQHNLRQHFLIAMGFSSLGLSMLSACGEDDSKDSGSDEPAVDPMDVDDDGDGVTENGNDCNDEDSSIFPGAEEIVNDGIDQDCDGVDLIDVDQDGFTSEEDCDDQNASAYPGGVEIINDGIDQDCDGVDLIDADQDGFTSEEDCDDNNVLINPNADEVCDDLDNNCDTEIDNNPVDAPTWYADTDGDGFGDPNNSVNSCDVPEGYTADDSDCNDTNNAIYPEAEELIDLEDNDCDGYTDETSCPTATEYTDAASLQSAVWSQPGPFMFCQDLPSDGSMCASIEDIDPYSLLLDTVGPPADPWCDWMPIFGTGCGPDPSITDACCYTLQVDMSCIAVGRPLTIEGTARLAPVCNSDQWNKRIKADPSSLTPLQRDILAQGWLKAAQEEHASVASFARFTMELMALGAPPELLTSATRAQADEIAHARSCFAIASMLTETDLGPGPLNIEGALLETTSFEHVLVMTILEGCINETLAAAEAAWLSEQAQYPSIKKAQQQIANDEAKHAALGWKTVKWILSQKPELRSVAIEAFEQAKSLLKDLEQAPQEDSWKAAWGQMPSQQGNQIRLEAWNSVIAPCATALLHQSCDSELCA